MLGTILRCRLCSGWQILSPKRYLCSTRRILDEERFQNLKIVTPAYVTAIQITEKPEIPISHMPKHLKRLKRLERIQFLDKNMKYIERQQHFLQALSRLPLKGLHLKSTLFSDRQQLFDFIRRFPTVMELSCSDIRFAEKAHSQPYTGQIPLLPHLRRVDVDGSLWLAALNGTFGSINKLQKVTALDVHFDDIPKVGRFLQQTAKNLSELNIRHMHVIQGDTTRARASWREMPEPLVLSHLKTLGIDVHGRERVTGVSVHTMVDILKWWTQSLEDTIKEGRVSPLERLTIILGIYKKDYILQYSNEIWMTLDRLLTQDQFSEFKSLRVIIKAYHPVSVTSAMQRTNMIVQQCPRLGDRLNVSVVEGTVIAGKAQFQNIEPRTPRSASAQLETGHLQSTS
ncbi:hypothetical protein IW261DRAFT_1492456 [Armillaria novae-zelandiae]|uniref:Uncharacterized protein n=1 Tax=Armillaria novae-zelandiae TaxID=153914 RepID=A0AA39UEZ2_9AGAR|nr:hypothetical protein IW261DRAFT_1492456 [Armillaria novae-zelandiae]